MREQVENDFDPSDFCAKFIFKKHKSYCGCSRRVKSVLRTFSKNLQLCHEHNILRCFWSETSNQALNL